MHARAIRSLAWALLWASLFYCSASKAVVGGDFSLTDQNGTDFSLSDVHGKVILLFFGYLSCPDICPDTLSRVAAVLKTLDTKASSVQAVFITVDPVRDSAERLKDYLGFFDNRIVGLTGSESEILEVARGYRASYRRINASTGHGYTMDHTSNIYIIDSKGAVARIVPPGLPVSEIVNSVRTLLSESDDRNDE